MQHRESMLRQQLVEEQAVAPFVGHRWRARPSVGIQNQRHARRARNSLGQQQCGVERGAVVGLYLELLRSQQMVGFQRPGRPDHVAFARLRVQPQRRRFHARRLPVDKRAACGSKVAGMKSYAGAQLLAFAVKAHLPDLLLQHVAFI